jgi:hypothetical protein
MKKASPIFCLLLLIYATGATAQTKKGVYEFGIQAGSASMTNTPSLVYQDGGSSVSFAFYRHHFFSKDWSLGLGAGYQQMRVSTNASFQAAMGQVHFALVPSNYQFNKLLFDYFNIPVLAGYTLFHQNEKAVTLRAGPSIGFLVNSRQIALVNNAEIRQSMPAQNRVKFDMHLEVGTVTLPAAKNKPALNLGFGATYQMNSLTSEPDKIHWFSAFFKLGLQF